MSVHIGAVVELPANVDAKVIVSLQGNLLQVTARAEGLGEHGSLLQATQALRFVAHEILAQVFDEERAVLQLRPGAAAEPTLIQPVSDPELVGAIQDMADKLAELGERPSQANDTVEAEISYPKVMVKEPPF